MSNNGISRGNVLSEEAKAKIRAARLAKGMSVEALALKSGYSEGTIKNIEKPGNHGTREAIVKDVCDALGLDLAKLLQERPVALPVVEVPAIRIVQEDPTVSQRDKSRRYRLIAASIVGLLLLSGLVAIGGRMGFRPYLSSKWDATQASSLDLNPINPEWTSWSEHWVNGKSGIVLNRFDFTQGVSTDDSVTGVVEISYHYEGLRPNICLNIYPEWEPFGEIFLFNGPLTGDGQQTITFQLKAPTKDGLYRVRLFQTSGHSPATSFEDVEEGKEVLFMEKRLVVVPEYALSLVRN